MLDFDFTEMSDEEKEWVKVFEDETSQYSDVDLEELEDEEDLWP